MYDQGSDQRPFQREFLQVSPSIRLEPSRALRSKVLSGTLDMAIVAQESEEENDFTLWPEEIAWFGNKQLHNGQANIGLLDCNCVLRDRSMADLETIAKQYCITLEAPSVASLKDAVEADFCQAYLPVSLA